MDYGQWPTVIASEASFLVCSMAQIFYISIYIYIYIYIYRYIYFRPAVHVRRAVNVLNVSTCI